MRVIRPALLACRAVTVVAIPLAALMLGVALGRGDREDAWLCVRTIALAVIGWPLAGHNLELDRRAHALP